MKDRLNDIWIGFMKNKKMKNKKAWTVFYTVHAFFDFNEKNYINSFIRFA